MYCSLIKINSDYVDYIQLIVLMHEIGHWLSHWPKSNNSNWEKGYSAKHKKTHESLAQLIAYWAVKDNSNLKNLLETHLTPSKLDDPYALYKNLTNKDPKDVLKKLVEIRGKTNDDDTMFDYLIDENHYDFNIFLDENRGKIGMRKFGV